MRFRGEDAVDRDVPGRDVVVDWHALSGQQALQQVGSTREGLSDDEARLRLGRWGSNELIAAPPKHWVAILADQVRSVVMGLLVAAMVVSWLTGDPLEAAAIGVVIGINAAIGFVTEFRARRAIHALAQLQAELATVLRGGQRRELAAKALVPGDVVTVEEGQRVPADIRLLEASGLRVDEAILTGESVPVVKDPGRVFAPDAGVHMRANVAFQGTAVVGGSAIGVVVATGSRTAVGHIGQLLESTPDEETPLERKLDALGRRLIGLTLAVAALVTVVGGIRGLDWAQTVKTGIALAVAAVPEGLPAIATIALAIGVRRMAKRNALVRRLPSVETLGSVTVVCTDKTGTLTTGQMKAASSWTLAPAAERDLIEAAVLANRAALVDVHAGKTTQLDPTEVALVEYAVGMGVDARDLHDTRPKLAEIPFTAERRMMASLHETPSGPLWYAKGAPAAILRMCAAVRSMDGDVALTPNRSEEILAANRALASEGLRVLGFAMSDPVLGFPGDDGAPEPPAEPDDLTFLGLIGLIDPPAPGVGETVQRFVDAGIRVVMITGDQRLTAAAVGRAVGIGTSTSHAVDMSEWATETESDIGELVKNTSVLARVSPEQKLDLVEALQAQGEVVAMLGDGVNDAAALKRADVGVAMGKRGAEVARQASDVILQDDRFESVGAAVAEGRVVFANIRKFAFYLFSCNLAEVLVLLTAGVLGWPMPLLPLQILWLNLVTDTFPALALAFEPAELDLMQRPPRAPKAPILGRGDVREILAYAIALTAVTLVACSIGLSGEPEGGVRTMTLTFTTLALAQVLHLGNARDRGPVLAPARALANRYALAGAATSIVLLVVAVTWEPLRGLLGVGALSMRDWFLVVGLAAIPAVVGQGVKLLRRSSTERRGGRGG